MTSFEFGEILLLNAYPFSDLSGRKKRPALVIADIGDEDVLVARITSEGARDGYDVSLERWRDAGLLLPSTIRISKMATLSKELILKRMGRLGSPERRKVRAVLRNLLGL